MFPWLRQLFRQIVTWFRPEPAAGATTIVLPPVIVELPPEPPPPSELLLPIEPHHYVPSTLHMGDCDVCGHLQQDAIHIKTEPPPISIPRLPPNRRDRWVKPKGEPPKPLQRTTTGERKPRSKGPLPELRPDEDPEQWGQFYFRDAILDQLETYFIYLRRMKAYDPDDYNLLKQVGIQLMPQSAIKSFDDWRNAKQLEELSAWWLNHRPGFGAVSYGIDKATAYVTSLQIVDHPDVPEETPAEKARLDESKGRVFLITGSDRTYKNKRVGIFWVPRFLYFTKYRRPPKDIERIGGADVYSMTVYWDRVDNLSPKWHLKHKGGVPQTYAVCVDQTTGAVRVLRMMLREQVKVRGKHGRNRGRRFSIPNNHWGIPSEYLYWAKGRKDDNAEDYLRRLFIEAALMYETASMGSMIRVSVSKDDLTAVFGVEIKRTPYFFKDRDIVLNDKGNKARVFHIVRPHVRKSGTAVPLHFRGLRDFDWAGYKVSITVPGRDHLFIPELGIASDAADAVDPDEYNKKYLTQEQFGKRLVDYIKDGVGKIR